jgi:purine-binding chemotaxis protein CheW
MKRTGVDWEQVRERLRSSETALEEALSESPARIEAAYRLRAAWLAKAAERKPVAPGVPLLVFRVAQERYGIGLHHLAEVLPFAGCTPAPGAQPQFRGVINVRGELRTVVDLGHLLTPSESVTGDSGFVLILRSPGRVIGLKVDRIEGLSEIRPEELGPPPQVRYVKGIGSGRLMMLSVDAILAEVFSNKESLTT